MFNFQYSFLVVRGNVLGKSIVTVARAPLSSLYAYPFDLVVVRCEFWDRSRNLLVTLGLSDRCRCGEVLIWNPVLSLLVTYEGLSDRPRGARWSFWDGSRNSLVTLGVSHRSRCGAVLILRWLAQTSRRLGACQTTSHQCVCLIARCLTWLMCAAD